MTSAYRYISSGGQPPEEVIILAHVNRFGAMAVFGRAMTPGELERLSMVDNVIRAYQSRKASGDWAKWAEQNPEYARLLAEVEAYG